MTKLYFIALIVTGGLGLLCLIGAVFLQFSGPAPGEEWLERLRAEKEGRNKNDAM